MNARVVVAWHNAEQRDKFLFAWRLTGNEPYLHMQQDKDKQGCAATKNKGIQAAIESGAEMIVVVDDDCFRSCEATSMEEFIELHKAALEPQDVQMFEVVTDPPSRGTPWFSRSVKMPVAASYGPWFGVGDYDAVSQLVRGATHPMTFKRSPIHGRYFAGSGMNMAFMSIWWPWCQFVDVARYDDIWQSWIWQKYAYSIGYCFNLNGPAVTHSRQSHVFSNLRQEAVHAEANETLWATIMQSKETNYEALRKLLPA